MIKMSPASGNGTVKVTFVLPANVEAVGVAGEFNGWDAAGSPFRKRTNGTRSAVVTLEKGVSYRFRYVGADGQWFNDAEAHGFVENGFGSTDCLVTT